MVSTVHARALPSLSRPAWQLQSSNNSLVKRFVCHAAGSPTIPLSEYMSSYTLERDNVPYVCSPLPEVSGLPEASVDRANLPVLIYLPGIDGTGLAAFKQFPVLMEHFNFMTFVTPPGDRSSYGDLVNSLEDFIMNALGDLPASQPVYVMGESFGGLLALSVAGRCPGIIDRVVLVNPATSYTQSLWPLIGPVLLQTPSEMYGALPILLAPVLGNPINLLRSSLDGLQDGSSVLEQAVSLVEGALGLLQQLPILAEILPRDTLEHKLKLLQDGCDSVEFDKIAQRVFILVGDQDLLLPSDREAERLEKLLARGYVRIEKGRSHSLLQEQGINIVSIMKQEGFYTDVRKLSAQIEKRPKVSTFGTPGPIELPTEIELKRYGSRVTQFSRTLSSPVFISTSEDGMRSFGLGVLPTPGERPIIFVGNHQSLALDMGIFIEEILKERGIMLRGLAHPAIFASKRKNNDAARIDAMPAFINALNGNMNTNNGTRNRGFESFLEEFGAVPVGPTNFVKLLANKEAILLYPGGVKEAYRKKGQEYQLFWPEKSEFVRMAAKYNAIIVPFAGVGVDDSLNILLDSDEMKNVPIMGSFVSQAADSAPQARRGVNATSGDSKDAFVSPIAMPKLPPNRLYYVFQQPISLDNDIVDDREACNAIYKDIRASVESGMQYLLDQRENDPYGDFRKRIIYEFSNRGSQAPSFDISFNDKTNHA